MDKYDLFKEHVKNAAEKFKEIDREDCIRIVSHLDADGISACSILMRALNRENRKYSTSIVQQLNEDVIEALSKEEYKHYIFTDLGSGQIPLMQKKLSDRNIIILDHHETDAEKTYPNIMHVNPHLFGIDGGKEISGAGVVFLFAKCVDERNSDMAHIAIVGAVGDIQENKGFLKLNSEILEDAKKNCLIEVKESLRVFGSQTRPIHKILEYTSDPYIPGVSGSESGAIKLLQDSGIDPKKGNSWKKLSDLTDEETKKLIAGVIMKRAGEKCPEDVLGFQYIIQNEKEGTPLREAKEFSTLLNACGRLDKASLGIGACLDDPKMKQKALHNLMSYKKEIVNAMNWYKENKDNPVFVTKEKGFIIINAVDNVMSTIIGTIASILSKSDAFEEGTLVMSLARSIDDTTKISLRVATKRQLENVDLHQIISQIVEKAGGESGGHCSAAGAVIKTEDEVKFLEIAKQILGKHSIEERVV